MPQLASAAGLGGLPPHKSELMASMSFVLAREVDKIYFYFTAPAQQTVQHCPNAQHMLKFCM